MDRNNLEQLDCNALIDCFQHKTLESFLVLAWDGSIEDLCPGIASSSSVIPIYVFKFLDDGKPLLLICSSAILPFRGEIVGKETIISLLRASEVDSYLDEIEIVTAVDMTELIDPIDSLFKIEPMPIRASIVYKRSGEIVGFFLWFKLGTQLGFVIGPVGMQAILSGGAFDAAYANAKSHQLHGDLEILEKEFSRSPTDDLRSASDIDWFG